MIPKSKLLGSDPTKKSKRRHKVPFFDFFNYHWLLLLEAKESSFKRRRQLLRGFEKLFHPEPGKDNLSRAERRLDECRSLVEAILQRSYLDFLAYDTLHDEISALEAAIKSYSIESDPPSHFPISVKAGDTSFTPHTFVPCPIHTHWTFHSFLP